MKQIIDISQHNGTIDFEKVKRAGINDVIIRVGWIGNKNNHTLDKRFKEYFIKAKQNGFNIGFYVYSYCKSKDAVLSGALWTLNQLKNLDFNLPVFIDLEDNSTAYLGKQELTSHAKTFCNYLKNHFKVGVYANLYWFNNKLDINELLDYKIWLAQYTSASNHSFKYKVDLWQYTSKGKISGIKGNVDISKCLCECTEDTEENNSNVESGDFEVAKVYKNGSTIEKVFADSNLTKEIGSLDRYEQCECIGIVNNRYIVKYKVNKTNNYKVGFVKYSGGIK